MDAFVTRLPRPQSELGTPARPTPLNEPDQDRPSKRAKREIPDSDSDQSHHSQDEIISTKKFTGKDPARGKDQDVGGPQPTDFENVMAPTDGGTKAIEEYEAIKSSQASAEDEDTNEKAQPLWVKGRSSIYLDAFNLALDTVLEEESHLFDDKENEVFREWRGLDYEAQYLCVHSLLRVLGIRLPCSAMLDCF